MLGLWGQMVSLCSRTFGLGAGWFVSVTEQLVIWPAIRFLWLDSRSQRPDIGFWSQIVSLSSWMVSLWG